MENISHRFIKLVNPFINEKLPTRCILEGETVLLLGDVVGKLMREKVAVVSGVDRVGALRAPPFSSFSSAISPISSSCWFTSFKRSITSSMDIGSWGRIVLSLTCTSRGNNSPHNYVHNKPAPGHLNGRSSTGKFWTSWGTWYTGLVSPLPHCLPPPTAFGRSVENINERQPLLKPKQINAADLLVATQ